MLLKLGQQIRQVYDRAEGCMRRGRRLPPISRLMQRGICEATFRRSEKLEEAAIKSALHVDVCGSRDATLARMNENHLIRRCKGGERHV